MDWGLNRDNWPLWAIALAGPLLAAAAVVGAIVWVAWRLGRAAGKC